MDGASWQHPKSWILEGSNYQLIDQHQNCNVHNEPQKNINIQSFKFNSTKIYSSEAKLRKS